MEPLRFALLGLGAGAAYGLVSQGLVLIYRSAGTINFAQGAMGMLCALLFFLLRDDHGMPVLVALLVTLVAAGLLGAAVHVLVMRPLANAPPLARLMSTLAILVLLLTLVQHTSNNGLRAVRPVLPTGFVDVLPGTPIGVDRQILFGLAVAITVALTVVYRRTRFGHATTATAENVPAAQALGISTDFVAAGNWAVSTTLSALAAILISSISGEFDPVLLTFLVLSGLAAALVGGFASFPLAFAGAIGLGIAESEMGRYVQAAGWAKAGPFIVIVLILVLRGTSLPIRGELLHRVPRLGSGDISRKAVVASIGVGVLVAASSTDWVAAVAATALAAMVILSLVVVVGFGGQVSLAQYTLAGMGAWVSARLVVSAGLPFEAAAAVAVVAVVAIGVVIGLAALRSRGVNLAVATLGAGVVLEQVILLNPAQTGGNTGLTVGDLHVLGVDASSVTHPRRYATLVLVALAVLMLMARNLRKSTAGLRLFAMRANERAAVSLGVDIMSGKLFAFAFGAAIAALAGVLMAFQNPVVVFGDFTVLHSITAVMQAVVGGVGQVFGAVIGGMLEPGSAGQKVLAWVTRSQSANFALALIGAIGALYVLSRRPDGIASRARRSRRAGVTALPGAARVLPRGPGGRLEVEGLAVRFGGVDAIQDVSLVVEPGEIVGLIGPNGSGKTTFIDAVAGFVPAARGVVHMNGREITRMSPTRRARLGLARTFQSLELFPGMTVADNFKVAADRRRMSAYLTGLFRPTRPTLDEATMELTRALELLDDLDVVSDEMSYGRRRLVAIARALATQPSVLLLDEPAAGLGPVESKDMALLLRRVAAEMGPAVLLVEHDMGLVGDVCDRIVVLDRGTVVTSGPAATVLEHEEVERIYLGGDEVARVGSSTAGVVARSAPPAGSLPVLRAIGIDAGYGALAAVRGLTLELRPGEIIGLLGPNGAGKTTSLLTLAGALKPLGGEVVFQGRESNDRLHLRVRRGLALVPEERSVISGLTTDANLRLGRGDPEVALDYFPELRSLLRRRAGLLSGGEQQMLTLGRALAARPALLLVDELSLGLAPMVVHRLYESLVGAARTGTAVLLVEQYTQRALEVADRIVVLNCGRVVLESSAAEARKNPDALRRAYLRPETAEGAPMS